MKTTLDVLLAILIEHKIDYLISDDLGFHCMIRLPHVEDKKYYPIKLICDFYGPSSPTAVLVHVCTDKDCCERPRHNIIPNEKSSTIGTLEDPEFYDFLVSVIDKWSTSLKRFK